MLGHPHVQGFTSLLQAPGCPAAAPRGRGRSELSEQTAPWLFVRLAGRVSHGFGSERALSGLVRGQRGGGDVPVVKLCWRSLGRARWLLREATRWEEEHPRRLRRQALTQLCFLFQQSTLRMDIEDCNGRSYISGTSDRGICHLFGLAHVLRRWVLPSGCKLAWLIHPRL